MRLQTCTEREHAARFLRICGEAGLHGNRCADAVPRVSSEHLDIATTAYKVDGSNG